MNSLRHSSIKQKQMLIIMGISGLALFLACGTFILTGWSSARQDLANGLLIRADIVGRNSLGALDFNDPGSAVENLNALKADSHVVSATLFTSDNQFFAGYFRNGDPSATAKLLATSETALFADGLLRVIVPVQRDEDLLGFIQLESDLTQLYAATTHDVSIALLVFALTCVMAFFLSIHLQKLLLDPIFELLQTARAVTADQNFALRAHKRSGDELGQLVDGFNEMLAEVQVRDAALRSAHDTLEYQVQKRTDELQRARSFLNSVIEHLPLPVFIKDAAELRFILWNKAGEELTGISNEEMLGKNDFDFFPPEDAKLFMTRDRRVLDSGQKIETPEEHLETRHRGTRIVHVIKSPIFNAEGKPTHLLGIVEDITERKGAEEKMAEINKRLLETSRLAGMAEVATGVLHNVGNVLNSVNVSANLIGDCFRKSKIPGFTKIVSLIMEHTGDLPGFFARDPRAAHLPGYLEQLAQHLTDEQVLVRAEIASLRKNIDHIKDIVAMQQSYAQVSGVTKMIRPAELIEDALSMNAGSLDRHFVEVFKEIEEVPPIEVDKHRVLQVLVNFVRNAKYACDESNRTDKRIILRLQRREDRVIFSVIANGVGISPENQERIFNHGFTTRKDGHGFGLHSSANAATELGGSVTFHSEGLGLGSTFSLELPVEPVSKRNTEKTTTPTVSFSLETA